MKRIIAVIILSSIVFYGSIVSALAVDSPVLSGSLDSLTPATQSIPTGVPSVDVARITVTATGGDIYLSGIYLATDAPGGLNNFTNIYVYDVTTTTTLKGTYPNLGENPNLVQFNPVIIGGGLSRTYLIRANLAYSAVGSIRVGFSGFTFANSETPTVVGLPIYGNTMILPGAVATPTPSPSPTPTPSVTPTPTPSVTPIGSTLITPASRGFVSLAALNLKEGDTISASDSSDPDIYIANEWGYKRLFLNPIIFGFYGHLGGFAKVRAVTSIVRDTMVTSGLFRNCETNDPRVYGIKTTGEDSGVLHWVNTSGTQAVADDADFFKKVFCINTKEFNWYSRGSDFTSVNQVPMYSR